MPAAGRGEFRRVAGGAALEEVLDVGTGLGHRLQVLQAHEVRVARQEQLAVGQAEQRGRVGGVPRLLGGPEGPRLGELALPLLGECLGHGRAYLVRVGRSTRRGHEAARVTGAALDQFVVQGRDLPAQTPKGAQSGDAHGRGGGGGEQQSNRHGAH